MARVLLLTFLGTLLTFAVSLMLGILGTILLGAMRGLHPDMRVAYREVALPCAVVAGAIAFVYATVSEVRHQRQARVLRAIERVS